MKGHLVFSLILCLVSKTGFANQLIRCQVEAVVTYAGFIEKPYRTVDLHLLKTNSTESNCHVLEGLEFRWKTAPDSLVTGEDVVIDSVFNLDQPKFMPAKIELVELHSLESSPAQISQKMRCESIGPNKNTLVLWQTRTDELVKINFNLFPWEGMFIFGRGIDTESGSFQADGVKIEKLTNSSVMLTSPTNGIWGDELSCEVE